MGKEAPVISVLMGVFNCGSTLDESLSCLEAQTESRWECILCDDGSTDHTADVIRKWQERYPGRFVFLSNEVNRGLSVSLNRCLEKANGSFVARMDGDDRCSPDRFEKELNYLSSHPEKAIVSTDMQCFDDDGIWGLRAYPTDPHPDDLVHGTPFCHAGCMVRSDAMRHVGGYAESEDYARVEDYDLWVRMYAAGFRGGNIHEPLYQMRDDRNAAARRKWKYRVNEARVRLNAVKLLNLAPWKAVFAVRPLVLGLLPKQIGSFLHRQKLKGTHS